ncbi:MAG: glycosyltransferase [Solobacterium sp.]|nr:glycosyltransferase [Solobacterium sp.]
MKICLLNDSFPPVIDGVANVIKSYADVLAAEKVHDVIVGTPVYPDAGYEKHPYPIITYPSLDVTALTAGYRAGYPFPVKEIAEMTQFAPDIIHTHCPIVSCFIARSLREASGAPVVFTYHTKYDIDIRRTIPVPQLQKESIRALVNNVSACDDVWAVSHGAADNLRSLGYEGNVIVMPNGVDFARGRQSEDYIEKLNREYDLPADVPVFLFVGRIMNYKGLPLILNALRVLKDEGKAFRMVFVGDGADRKPLIKKAEEYGFTVYVKEESGITKTGDGDAVILFAGAERSREMLRAWNTRADLFVFPSTFDTNGLVVREAAACGLASVLIKDSCAAEGVTDGRNGYLVEENYESLAQQLIWACGHMEELHTAGENAMNEIYLSWADAVHLAEKRYAEVLDLKKAGRLPEHRKLADDPLFEMTADAVHRYIETHTYTMPHYEGMLENFEETLRGNQQILEDILRELKEGFFPHGS